MPREYPRADRVEQLAREVLGEAIQDLKDPRVGFATVTNVSVSPGLRNAKVFVSVLGSEEQRTEAIEAIQHAAPYLRSVLGREVRMKYVPQLEFVEDETAAYGERIESLLRQVGASKAPEVESVSSPPLEHELESESDDEEQ